MEEGSNVLRIKGAVLRKREAGFFEEGESSKKGGFFEKEGEILRRREGLRRRGRDFPGQALHK